MSPLANSPVRVGVGRKRSSEPGARRPETEIPHPYDHAAIEARWRAAWQSGHMYATPETDERESTFVVAGCMVASKGADLGDVRAIAIADVYARVQRARGRAVLFSLSFSTPPQVTDAGLPAVRRELERLGCSLDWDRVHTFEPVQSQWTQRIFLALLEQGLVYLRGDRWILRTSAYAEEADLGLDALEGWSDAAVQRQRDALGRVVGVELDAVVVGGESLCVFTPYVDSVDSSDFIAVSPEHPAVGGLAAEPEVAARVEEEKRAEWHGDATGMRRVGAVATGLQASVPGVEKLLPVVVTPLFDDRFGATAVLGIPDRDSDARQIAKTFEQRTASPWTLTKTHAKPRPAVRYGLRDVEIASPGSVGVAVPLISCLNCDTEPMPLDRLPAPVVDKLDDGSTLECPRCGGPAQPVASTITPWFDQTWMWMSPCMPADDRAASAFGHTSLRRWLPAQRVVGEEDAGSRLLYQRVVARMLHDVGQLPEEAREPAAGVVVCGSVRTGGEGMGSHADDGGDAAEVLERVGADVFRLALLHAAAPTTAFAWHGGPIRRCQRFLAELWSYAEPRLRDWEAPTEGTIVGSTRWRRRLAKWCRVGADKVATDVERFHVQRATHNAILLLARIEDFESRVLAADGELGEEDHQAVVAALLVLLQVLAPFVPHVAEELWSIAGPDTPLTEMPWPDLS